MMKGLVPAKPNKTLHFHAAAYFARFRAFSCWTVSEIGLSGETLSVRFCAPANGGFIQSG
ncbi:hypothetical protein EII21_11430 [Conchiformibius steedae]|uniref:Uncharacterized protein n=1 Tax=Conchiformibius steedae TaxID=153493 RepID=A0A3P1ZZ77_9NEIS|nr:hypothetical protein EII21_11430 [Conchiformibius steedae]